MIAKPLDRATKMILAAKCPLIMVGGAASRLDQHSIAQIRDIARRLGIPYFATQLGKGVMAEDSDLYMGTAALSKGDHVHVAVDKADLIIAVGYDKCEKPPFIMLEGGPKVIHIAYQPASFTQAYRPHLEVIGDIGSSVTALADRLEGKLPNAGALLPLREGILALNCDGADEEMGLVTLDGLVHAVELGQKILTADCDPKTEFTRLILFAKKKKASFAKLKDKKFAFGKADYGKQKDRPDIIVKSKKKPKGKKPKA
ncbi:hypothetical protein [Rhizobium bangladeshense]|uniref:hypothetical protein n=1 Tax=Rhizobium bangladeshense TaxID=1138189 RepID=UPI0007E5710A|nr:hypothetical protein [Rhizobium bangladeshense]